MSESQVSISVRVRVAADDVWAALTDWRSQSAWITATKVRTVDGDGRGVGGRIEAFTGFGPLGFLDTMVVTEWEPPKRCVVRHTGNVVRGTGAFEVAGDEDVSRGTTLTWYEDLEIPGGTVGAFGYALAKPVVEYMVTRSLKRFARLLEERSAPPGE
ncbi:SRPBCC family protein [Actinospica robiniae]|uniref:SRPBCC family protein n=1 Tax=Actinospica robiniae TaxID=304901 RepID=UPI0003F69106|nr:SRPBCC family protein [Actinospica robiniae]